MLPKLSPPHEVAVFAIAAPVIYLCTVGLGRYLKRREKIQLSVMYKLLGLCLAVYLPMRFLGWDAVSPPFQLSRELAAACILLGIIFLLSLLKRYLWEYYFVEKRGMTIPKFVREIVSFILFAGALVLVLSHVYGIEQPPGVVLSSTVVVGIVGWAMQDLLGNVIAGVALQVGKPFKSGDWLIVENQHAEVIEVNWRSTRLRTNDDHYLDVPNAAIVRSTIVNLSYPSPLHAMRIRIGIASEAPPNTVKRVLLEAARAAEGVLASPPPKVFLVEFADSAITYEIKYWMEHHAAYNEISDRVRTSIWYALNRAGIQIPNPIRDVFIVRKRPEPSRVREETYSILRNKHFFKCLPEEHVRRILGAGRVLLFARGERIVAQGDEGSSMFVLLDGEAAVSVAHPEHGAAPTQVARLHAGDYFGEMSLLTGEKRSATIEAGTDSEVLEIAKTDLAPILQENAEVLQHLSAMLAQRRLETEGVLAASPAGGATGVKAKEQEYTATFLHRVAKFFEL